MRAKLIHAPCPGFGLRRCLHCKRPWISSASDMCIVTNQYCPDCIPAITCVLPSWKSVPEVSNAEKRIQARLEVLRRAKALKVEVVRRQIRESRQTA